MAAPAPRVAMLSRIKRTSAAARIVMTRFSMLRIEFEIREIQRIEEGCGRERLTSRLDRRRRAFGRETPELREHGRSLLPLLLPLLQSAAEEIRPDLVHLDAGLAQLRHVLRLGIDVARGDVLEALLHEVG